MRLLHTEVDIAASIERVWDLLADIERYPEWNPLLPKARGKLVPNEILEIEIQTPGTSAKPYRVELLEVEVPRRLVWLGHFYLPGLCDGLHTLELCTVSANSTRVLHYEQFRGVLVPFVWGNVLNRDLRASFEAHNRCLRQRAEAIADQAAQLSACCKG